MSRVCFIGLGVMGYPMAGHLRHAEHEICVFNRTPARAEDWLRDYGGTHADTPAEAVRDAEFVFACVGNDADLREVALGANGALAGMESGAVFIDHTTVSADVAEETAQALQSKGIEFLDAPISGGEAGAVNGQLTIMVGGAESVFARAVPIMEAYGKTIRLMGAVGAGQRTKMVNQICIAGLVQSLAEGLHFAEQAGLDGRAVIDVIAQGAAQSWQMENRFETMLDDKFDFGFAVDWMRKDLAICLDEARRNGALLPLVELVDGYYADIQKLGGGRYDTSSLIHRLRALKAGRL